MSQETIILSIDPGYERLGVAVMKKNSSGVIHRIHSECFKTDPSQTFVTRLLFIGDYVTSLIDQYKPTVLAIENLFIQNNQKTAMRVSETRGVILYISKKLGLSVYEFTPLQIKSVVTGSGRSDKASVQKMVILQLPEMKLIPNLLDDEYDAVACGLTYFALEKSL